MRLAPLLLALVLWTGAHGAASAEMPDAGIAQTLPLKPLTVQTERGDVLLHVQVADTDATRQTGLMQMKVAELTRDADLLPRVQHAAEVMLTRHPDNIGPLLRRWVGARERYGKV